MTAVEPSVTAVSDADGCAPRRGRPRSAEVDEAVLLATVELLGEVGVSRLSMDEVAERAKVSKATIYRRWSSKEALVIDALNGATSHLDDPDTGTLRGDLERYLRQVARRFKTGRMSDVLPHLIEVACHDPALRSSLDHYVQTRRRPLMAIVERARERGEIRDGVDLEVLVDAIIGPFIYRRLLSRMPLSDTFVARLLDLVLPSATVAPAGD